LRRFASGRPLRKTAPKSENVGQAPEYPHPGMQISA
jgi:hypothetical protein